MSEFSFYELLRLINTRRDEVGSWSMFEDYLESLCRIQDPNLIRQHGKHPDLVLSCGGQIEAKTITSKNKSINLNSAPPDNTYYVCVYIENQVIEAAAIIHGHNYLTPEMTMIKTLHRGTAHAENPSLKYRVRLMWEIESPFKIYGHDFFLVDRAGGVIQL